VIACCHNALGGWVLPVRIEYILKAHSKFVPGGPTKLMPTGEGIKGHGHG
jgi:hypothetical protein